MKGYELTIYVVGAAVIFIISIGLVWGYVSGNLRKSGKPTNIAIASNVCRNHEDCSTPTINPNGALCIQIYPGNFTSFCGCIINEDCINRRGGVCGSDNRCAFS